MVFLTLADIEKAAYRKFGRMVKGILPIGLNFTNTQNSSKGGVSSVGIVSGFNPPTYAFSLAKKITGSGSNIYFDQAFFGNINVSWLYSGNNGLGPLISSHIYPNVGGSIMPMANPEWTYQNQFPNAPVNAAINVSLQDIFLDQIYIFEPTPSLYVTGSGYLIQF